MVEMTVDKNLFNEAKRYIPGGVNSPVRSFSAIGGNPIFMKEAGGSKIYSYDGRKFIDYCLSWGVFILGHANPQVVRAVKEAVAKGTSFGTATKLETELARLITDAMPSIEQVRLTNSGTEAVMGAVRLARAFTKKDKIIKFEGSYHGHADYFLAEGSVPGSFTRHTITAPYNDINTVEGLVKRHKKALAAIIVEPVAANCGVILPSQGFLMHLRKICDKYSIMLIFDEVITGFRLSYGGAQAYFKVKPDLTCLGKIIGGGLPVGAFGGRKEIMQLLAPLGDVYQAGTLSGNPIAVTAGIVTLNILKKANPYAVLEKKARWFCGEIEMRAKYYRIQLKVNQAGSMFSLFFTGRKVTDYKTAKTQDTELFRKFFREMLKRKIYFSPSGFEADFLSTAHSEKDFEDTLKAIGLSFNNIRRR